MHEIEDWNNIFVVFTPTYKTYNVFSYLGFGDRLELSSMSDWCCLIQYNPRRVLDKLNFVEKVSNLQVLIVLKKVNEQEYLESPSIIDSNENKPKKESTNSTLPKLLSVIELAFKPFMRINGLDKLTAIWIPSTEEFANK
jgi:hypothetical protein